MVSANLFAGSCSTLFFTDDGRPTKGLVALLELDGLYDPADTLVEIADKTQKAWIQVNHGIGNKERTDLQDSQQQLAKREQIIAAIEALGLFQAQMPSKERYDYAVVSGAFLESAGASLTFIINTWKRGTRFDAIVFLTGERPLRKGPGQEDDPAKLKSFPENMPYETEHDMCKLLWRDADLPEDMRVQVSFINARAPTGFIRPSRRDCFEEWLKSNPKPGTILAASHPLYWSFQQLAGENVLPDGFTLETCSDAATEDFRKPYANRLVSVMLDTIAKCIYEIKSKNC